MKRLYTSNFARNSTHPQAVSISAKPPFYFYGPERLDLAPTWDFLTEYKKGIIDEREYTKRYLHLLTNIRGLTPQAVADSLDGGTVMLCYEKAKDFCHRHIVAVWLMDGADVEVIELLAKHQ